VVIRWCFGGLVGLLIHLALLKLATRQDEMIVVAVTSPRAGRHVADFNKLPIYHVRWG
jgi:hypothetical protein